MMKKGASRLVIIVSILVAIIIISVISFFIYKNFFQSDVEEDFSDEISSPSSEEKYQEERGRDFIEGGEGRKGSDAGGGGGGGGGEGKGASEDTESEEETDDEVEAEPTASLRLLNFDYEIIEEDLVKVTGITYGVDNVNTGPLSLELFLYIYDESDDDPKKGLVRDQINIGVLDYGETITETSSVSAYYRGNLNTEKTFKITLIGYLSDQSYNLGSVSEEVIFE